MQVVTIDAIETQIIKCLRGLAEILVVGEHMNVSCTQALPGSLRVARTELLEQRALAVEHIRGRVPHDDRRNHNNAGNSHLSLLPNNQTTTVPGLEFVLILKHPP